MIIYFLLLFVVYVISLLFAPFPVVEELPWGVDAFLSGGISQFRLLTEFFPPLSTVLDVALIYLTFRISIIVLRFFLGSRTPTQH